MIKLTTQYRAGIFAGFGSPLVIAQAISAAGLSIQHWQTQLGAWFLLAIGAGLARRDQDRSAKSAAGA